MAVSMKTVATTLNTNILLVTIRFIELKNDMSAKSLFGAKDNWLLLVATSMILSAACLTTVVSSRLGNNEMRNAKMNNVGLIMAKPSHQPSDVSATP